MAKFFNSNIKFLRKSRNLSQEDVAEGSGIDRSVLSRIENNKIETSVENAYKLSTYFNVPIDILIGNDMRLEQNVVLDENYQLDVMIQDIAKELTKDGKKQLIDILNNLPNIDKK